MAALRKLARHPAAHLPSSLHVEAFSGSDPDARWCALAAAGDRPLRATSWAQNISASTGSAGIYFYVTSRGWSYGIFEAGMPVFTQEAHLGEPVFVGNLARGAAALGVPPAILKGTLARVRDPAAHVGFARALGLHYPTGAATAISTLGPPSPVTAPAAAPETTGPVGLQAGEQAVMPPLGVVFIKSVEPGVSKPPVAGGSDVETSEGRARDVYVVISGSSTLRVPVQRAAALGMRALVDGADAQRLLAQIAEGPLRVPNADTYEAERARGWLSGLKRGELAAIAESYRQACYARGKRRLTDVESGLMDSARTWLADELSAALKRQRDDVDDVLRGACQ